MQTCRTYMASIIILISLGRSGTFEKFIDIPTNKEVAEDAAGIKEMKQNGPKNLKKERIVGGNDTTIEQYPFMISLHLIDGSHICGGSLIHKLWVLTASHCITENQCLSTISTCNKGAVLKIPSEYAITAGTSSVRHVSSGQRREIKEFIKHPGFSRPLLHNDIGLIEVKNPFVFSKKVQIIKLPQVSLLHEKDITYQYEECIALGWGTQKAKKAMKPGEDNEIYYDEDDMVAPILNYVKLPVIPIELCKKLISDKYITNRHMCTMYAPGGKDACEGDSGGPLVCGKWLYGITSWGHGCAQPNLPAVFTRTDTYYAWIQNVINGYPNIDYYRSSNYRIVSLRWMIFVKIFPLIYTIFKTGSINIVY